MKPVYLTGAVRTPIGRFGGSLQSWTAADLGTAVAKETLRRANVLAAQQIMLGRANIVLAGGAESMSRVPYFAEGARWGTRIGHAELVDGMYRDGFNDPLSGLVMGQTAENLARRYEISRTEQDEYALRSQQRAQAALESGRFAEEVLALEIKDRKDATASF